VTWIDASVTTPRLPERIGMASLQGLYELFGWWWADPVDALAMLPVICWQGWETLVEA
jgi:divalent metal cation (Fe/Co/Zn/Cd) transporter